MSDIIEKAKIKKKPTSKRNAKMLVVMGKHYCPSEEFRAIVKPFLDGLGRLPKDELVEVPQKLGAELLAQNLASLPEGGAKADAQKATLNG